MKIAVDKNSYKAVEKDENEYIYLFEDEPLQDLLKTNLHCIRYTDCNFVDINLTDYEVESLKKTTLKDPDWKKVPDYINFKIGIIIPNYNYEHTIDKCLKSIAEQTYKNYEVIFVDDVSTDTSVEVASKYKDKLTELKIVQLKQKRLNGGARNEGYLYLSNDVDYIYYVDSDDWLNGSDVLEEINRKLQTKPDILFVGMAQWKNNELRTCFLPDYKDKYEAMVGWSGSCGKVIKKGLATRQECLYNEGTLKEDRNQHFRVCIYMNSFALLKKPVYVWNQMNSKSVTTIREKIIWGTSTIRHYADTLQLALSVKGMDSKVDRILNERVMRTKQEVLNGGDKQW